MTDLLTLMDGATPHEREARKARGIAAVEMLRKVLSCFTFAGSSEADVQRQVVTALTLDHAYEGKIIVLGSEVVSELGRFDVLVEVEIERVVCRVVLELKVRGTAAAAERQSQRYAKTPGVDAVALLTTSSRLLRDIAVGQEVAISQTLGGKPFGAIYLRPF